MPGSIAPTSGHCPTGYVYLPSQDSGPALCIPTQGANAAGPGGSGASTTQTTATG